MASNLEKMRAKKAQNKSLEASVTASYSIDPMENSDDSNDNNAIIDTNDSHPKKSSSSKNSGGKVTTKESRKPIEANYMEPISSEINKEPSKTINNIKPIIPIDGSSEKSLGLRLASEEDKRYLNLAPLSRSMTKKAFFMNLIHKEVESSSEINIYDPLVEVFRDSSLKTAAITIAVPESLIAAIKDLAAKHMMKYQRYVAYVVYKARKEDSSWK